MECLRAQSFLERNSKLILGQSTQKTYIFKNIARSLKLMIYYLQLETINSLPFLANYQIKLLFSIFDFSIPGLSLISSAKLSRHSSALAIGHLDSNVSDLNFYLAPHLYFQPDYSFHT